MWLARKNLIAGMIYGKVDWIDQKEGEIGLYLRPTDRDQDQPATRCVLRGAEVNNLLANRLVQKGMTVTAHGTFTARAFARRDTGEYMAELICEAAKLLVEKTRELRFRGAVNANIKGVVMSWDPGYHQVKTFFNAGEDGLANSFTCSIALKNWLTGLGADSRERVMANIRAGREYTSAAMVDVSCYRNKDGVTIPSLLLLPTDFKLQG